MTWMNRSLVLAGCGLAAAMGLAAPAANAAWLPGAGRVAVTAMVGTLGIGGAVYAGNRTLDLRLGGNYFALSHDITSGSVHYHGHVRLESFPLLADWHPFHGHFRLSVGGIYNLNEGRLTARPVAGTYTINGHSYTAQQVGSLTGEVTFNHLDPYVGIGFGNPFYGTGHWTFGLDLGVVYQGTPKVGLSATGAASDPALANDVQQERASVESTVSKYKWYPVAMLSVGYRF